MPQPEQTQRRTGEGLDCASCRCFVLVGDSDHVGTCHRRTPNMGAYPVVYVTDWCGDHMPNEQDK